MIRDASDLLSNAMIRDASDLLSKLLDGGHSTIAGRLAGAFRNCGRGATADEIVAAMIAAGYAVRESDPFGEQPGMTLPLREISPYVNRIKLLWQKMRGSVIEAFPHAPGLPRNKAAYMERRRSGLRNSRARVLASLPTRRAEHRQGAQGRKPGSRG